MSQNIYVLISYISEDLLLSLEKLFKLIQPHKSWNAKNMSIAIAGSTFAIAKFNESELIGFARVTSDGSYRAMIWDLLVHPDHKILDQMVEAIKLHSMVKNIERLYLINEDDYLDSESLSQIGSINPSTTMVFKNERI
jgi:hypothetical protein